MSLEGERQSGKTTTSRAEDKYGGVSERRTGRRADEMPRTRMKFARVVDTSNIVRTCNMKLSDVMKCSNIAERSHSEHDQEK
jgi:hypothetical protein